MGFNGPNPLVMTNIANWKIMVFHGKIHGISMVMFHSEIFNYQRLPVGYTIVGPKIHETSWKFGASSCTQNVSHRSSPDTRGPFFKRNTKLLGNPDVG